MTFYQLYASVAFILNKLTLLQAELETNDKLVPT